jgi:NAD(P)-dependent dehydrogenase (short-subunit alcohol dehydrogenase family)
MNFSAKMLRDNALSDKVIVVTGGGSGLGKAMTQYFLELGAKVAITSRDLEKLKITSSELEKQTKEGKRQQPNAAANVDLMQMPSLELQQRLLSLVGGNMAIAQRLIDIAKQDHPNMPEVWYWQKVIFDLESDQRPRN